MNSSQPHLIFVYGTLLKGQRNYPYFLKQDQFVTAGTIDGFIMYDIGFYPGIIDGSGRIRGEVYAVDDASLRKIDLLEGEGELYESRTVTVTADSGETLEAAVYVYLLPTAGLPVIPYEEQPYHRAPAFS